MSLDFTTPLLPSPTSYSSPDFITTQPRKTFHHGSSSVKSSGAELKDGRQNESEQNQATAPALDRRTSREPSQGHERRQFGSSHANLSPAATELAIAIDQYKLEHRRRYITCEEMLMVITKLGYNRSDQVS